MHHGTISKVLLWNKTNICEPPPRPPRVDVDDNFSFLSAAVLAPTPKRPPCPPACVREGGEVAHLRFIHPAPRRGCGTSLRISQRLPRTGTLSNAGLRKCTKGIRADPMNPDGSLLPVAVDTFSSSGLRGILSKVRIWVHSGWLWFVPQDDGVGDLSKMFFGARLKSATIRQSKPDRKCLLFMAWAHRWHGIDSRRIRFTPWVSTVVRILPRGWGRIRDGPGHVDFLNEYSLGAASEFD